jgi:hypothetical protein
LVNPSGSDPVEGDPLVPLEPGVLGDLLAEESPPAAVVTSSGAAKRYRGVTNEPISPRRAIDEPLSRHPLAPASERSKDRLIGGKPIRFNAAREFMAVVLIVGVMAVAYLCFWGLHGEVKRIENVGKGYNEARKKMFVNGIGPRDKTKDKPKKIDPGLIGRYFGPRTLAPLPVEIDGIEVCVYNALVAKHEQPPAEKHLRITLKVTNRGSVPVQFDSWTRLANGLVLRDRSRKPAVHPLVGPPVPKASLVRPGETIYDTLVFRPTPADCGLELDLPVKGSDKAFLFLIQAQDIQRIE